jgi:glycosyltransferase involved in cell wall biosynthesis
MHFPHFNVPILYRKRFVLTIHDLILVHFPTIKGTTLNPIWYKIKYLAYKLAISNAIKKAHRIFAVSQFTKDDILQHYPVAESKIEVTYEACENYCRIAEKNGEQITKKYGIIMPYVMYVGNAYPHKNLEKLIDAFEIFSHEKPGFQLVFVGKEDYFYKRLKNYVLKKKIQGVRFLGFVPDDELDVLYRFSELYVFPSLYEGFGLPPLEAMAKGTAVVSSDHKCMKEILGEAAFFVEASKPKAIADGMTKVLDDEFLKKELIFRGYRQIEKYDWSVMARQTLEVYDNLLD